MKLTPVQLKLAKTIHWYGWIEDVGSRSLAALEKRGLVQSELCQNSAIRRKWTLTDAGREAIKVSP